MEFIDLQQFDTYYANIPYAKGSPAQTMDIALPDGEGPFPVVVFIHGGGWFFGDKRSGAAIPVFKFVSQGYAVVTLNYRLSTEAVWPAQIHDVKAAIRYLRAEGAGYRLDTSRLVACGNSAGAHLCAMLAAAPNCPELEDRSMGHAEASDHIDGVICWYGPFDLVNEPEHRAMLKLGSPTLEGKALGQAVTQLLGAPVNEVPEIARSASPINYVTRDHPPVLFQHGTADQVVPYLQSVEMATRINEICGLDRSTVELFPYEGHGHPGDMFKTDKNITRCIQFVDSIYGIERKEPIVLPALDTCESNEDFPID